MRGVGVQHHATMYLSIMPWPMYLLFLYDRGFSNGIRTELLIGNMKYFSYNKVIRYARHFLKIIWIEKKFFLGERKNMALSFFTKEWWLLVVNINSLKWNIIFKYSMPLNSIKFTNAINTYIYFFLQVQHKNYTYFTRSKINLKQIMHQYLPN